MKAVVIITGVVSAATLGLLCSPTSTAAAAGASATLDGLRLDVHARADSILIGEPLVLSISLTNVSGGALQLPLALRQRGFERHLTAEFHHSAHHGDTSAEYRPESGFTIDYVIDKDHPGAPVVLRPGETVECTYMYGAQAAPPSWRREFGTANTSFVWTTPQAGTYHVAVTYYPWSSKDRPNHWFGKLEAPEFSVVVVEPSTAADREALEIWKRARTGLARLGVPPSPMNPEEVIPACEHVYQAYANSVYAPFAMYVRARYELDWRVRADLLEELISSNPAFKLIDQVKYELAEAIERYGGNAEAAVAAAVAENANHVARIDQYGDSW